jgi:hypothetical protein
VYYYDLAVPDSSGATFNNGDLITFSGMSGVTSAYAFEEVSTAFAAGVSFTSSEVVFVSNVAPYHTSNTYPYDQGAPYFAFVIDPPASSYVGMINWSIQDADGTFSGTVPGPVAPATTTPEPSLLTVFGLGIVSLWLHWK